MIDPTKITNYNLNQYELEEMILFWLMVAGKNAKTTSRLLERFLQYLHWHYEQPGNNFKEDYKTPQLRPFEMIRTYVRDHPHHLETLLQNTGFGCYSIKAKGIKQLVHSNLDLQNCTVNDLEKICCIGPKTARCFIMHSREDARLAGLDTHVLKWLRELGYQVPKGTPAGRAYIRLERLFLEICDLLGKKPAVLDLEIWNAYSVGGSLKVDNITLPKQENHGENKRNGGRIGKFFSLV